MCQANYAASVKIIAPHRSLRLLYLTVNGSVFSAVCRDFRWGTADDYSLCDIISLTPAAIIQEVMMPKRKPIDLKLKTLQEQASLNPRPQAVTDPLFHQSDFFDPRDLVQVKYEMLRRVRVEGRSVRQACLDFGFSRT